MDIAASVQGDNGAKQESDASTAGEAAAEGDDSCTHLLQLPNECKFDSTIEMTTCTIMHSPSHFCFGSEHQKLCKTRLCGAYDVLTVCNTLYARLLRFSLSFLCDGHSFRLCCSVRKSLRHSKICCTHISAHCHRYSGSAVLFASTGYVSHGHCHCLKGLCHSCISSAN